MKILIIGNRSHQFICNYVISLRNEYENKNVNITVDILSQDINNVSFSTDKLYDNIYSLASNSPLTKIRLFRGIIRHYKFRSKLKQINNYDIIHIHYVEDVIARNAAFFSNLIKGKLVVTIWGSDFLRASDIKRKQMAFIFRRANKITIATREVANKFIEYYKNFEFDKKISICRFGLQPIEEIVGLKNSNIEKSECKKNLNLANKLTIAIGYNASKMQHHIDIINHIEESIKLSEYKDNIQFILPLTYPLDKDYINIIKARIRNSKFKYIVFDYFLSNKEIAILRKASDIFIQLQPTDMLSGSMLEHLAADNIVITGSWLPYNCLDEWGAFLIRIDLISSVADTLVHTIENLDYLQDQCNSNFHIISQKNTWSNVIIDWIKAYEK